MAILENYFSFEGRLARLRYFIRSLYLSIAVAVPVVACIMLFSSGSTILWWLGLALVIVSIAALAVSTISLTVRRLHDLGLSGFHAIWVGAADLLGSAMSYGPDYTVWLSLPLIAVSLWLLVWPGNRGDNRYGAQPA